MIPFHNKGKSNDSEKELDSTPHCNPYLDWMGDPPVTISELAVAVGVPVTTIRYYERIGLIPEPVRLNHGYRRYGQALGFTLAETAELLRLRGESGASRAEVRDLARRKIDEIRLRVAALTELGRQLEALVEACDGDGPVSGCPILEILEDPAVAGPRGFSPEAKS
jgi:MerR family transcriptional regulator, copper efflux regulator